MMREEGSGQRFGQYKRRSAERRTQHIAVDNRGNEVKRKRHRGFVELFVAFWGMLRPYHTTVHLCLGALTVSVLFGLIPLYAPKIVIDNVLGGRPLPEGVAAWLPFSQEPRALLVGVVGIALLMTMVSVAFGLWGRWHITRITKRVQVDARRDLFDHTARLPMHRIYELKSGGVSGLLRDDAGAIGDLLFGMIYNPWRAVVQLVGSLAVLAWVDWKLLTLGLAVLPVVWVTHRTWIARIRPLWRDIRKTRREIDGTATETFGGMRIVRGFNRHRSESTAFMKRNDYMVRQELLGWWWMRGVDTAWAILIPVASSALLVYGAWRIMGDHQAVAAGLLDESQRLTVGDLTAFLMYLAALLGPVAALASTATALQNGLAALDRVLDILNEPREFEETATKPALGEGGHAGSGHQEARFALDPDTVAGRVTLDRVAFSYPGTTRRVLEDVSLEAEPGSVVALVGPSGAGKTTLCNLVARFYDPTAGRVLIDGHDLRDLDVGRYRSLLGIVEQDVFLFDGTVAGNIAYGRRHASQPQVEHAARAANAHGFITDLPDGYDTRIGERGVKLSGGQRQRLAIARAILADPKILILDEATSNLDTESERLIHASLRRLMEGRTSFVIAHRLSTITHADQIIVLSGGGILERGTHAELMQRGGVYEGMIQMQVNPAAQAHA